MGSPIATPTAEPLVFSGTRTGCCADSAGLHAARPLVPSVPSGEAGRGILAEEPVTGSGAQSVSKALYSTHMARLPSQEGRGDAIQTQGRDHIWGKAALGRVVWLVSSLETTCKDQRLVVKIIAMMMII